MTTIMTNKNTIRIKKPANLPRDASQHGGCQYVQWHHWVIIYLWFYLYLSSNLFLQIVKSFKRKLLIPQEEVRYYLHLLLCKKNDKKDFQNCKNQIVGWNLGIVAPQRTLCGSHLLRLYLGTFQPPVQVVSCHFQNFRQNAMNLNVSCLPFPPHQVS